MRATAVNPRILVWARERAGHSIEEVARILGREVSEVSGWESGAIIPHLGQLEKLAYSVYHRPLAVFFFPKPPEIPPIESEFRALPQAEIAGLEPDTRYALREARAMQMSLYDVTDGANLADPCLFREIRLTVASNVQDLAVNTREMLGVDIHSQMRWRGSREAFGVWRNAVETAGIFVFKRPIDQLDISAFCLLDKEFPVIYINNKTTFTRQIFSLFHEVAHILFNISGLTKVDTTYVQRLSDRDRKVELICNRFASEVLIPSEDFSQQLAKYSGQESEIRTMARRYKVSPAVVLRRLLDNNIISQSDFDAAMFKFEKDFYLRSHRRNGGDYYATQASYLGHNFLRLAFARYNSGRWSLQQLSNSLNIKARYISRLESYVSDRAEL